MSSSGPLWIANNASHLDHLKHAVQESNSERNGLAISTRRGGKGKTRAGDIVELDGSLVRNVLCSRAAKKLDSYIPTMVDRLKDLGLQLHYYMDRMENKKAFIVIREPQILEMGAKFTAGRAREDICKIFTKGWSATPFDFKKISDFKKLLSDEKVNMVLIDGQRDPDLYTENFGVCSLGNSQYELRPKFRINLADGNKVYSDKLFWRDKYPTRTCADTPRVALGFSQDGMVDIPAIARLFVVCTFGKPYVPKKSGKAGICHELAKFNEATEKCECVEPKNDLIVTTLFPLMDDEKKITEPGLYCLNPNFDDRRHRVVLIGDISGRVADTTTIVNVVRALVFPLAYYKSHVSSIAYGYNTGTITRRTFNDWEYSDISELWKDNVDVFRGINGPSKTFREALQNAYDELYAAGTNKRLLIVITAGGFPQSQLTSIEEEIAKLRSVGVQIMMFGIKGATKQELDKYDSNSMIIGDTSYIYSPGVQEVYTRVSHRLLRNVYAAPDAPK